MITYRQCTKCEGRGWTFNENLKTMKHSKQICTHCGGHGKFAIKPTPVTHIHITGSIRD